MAVERPEMDFEDPHAEAIVKKLGIDPHDYCSFLPSMLLTIYRSWCLDRLTTAFFLEHPEGRVVNLACGLGTNFDRVAGVIPTSSSWVDADLPEVIDVRRRFFRDEPRRQMIQADVTSEAVVANLVDQDRPTLVILEGILFYLEPARVADVFRTVARVRDGRASATELAFDFVSVTGLAMSAANTDLQRTGTSFRWAFEGIEQVRAWDPRLVSIATGHHGEFVPESLRPFFFDAMKRDGVPPAGVVHLSRHSTS